MSGNQVVTFLYEQAEDTAIRWSSVLEAFLKAAPAIPQGDLTETDDAAAATAVQGGAAGAGGAGGGPTSYRRDSGSC